MDPLEVCEQEEGRETRELKVWEAWLLISPYVLFVLGLVASWIFLPNCAVYKPMHWCKWFF